MPEGKIVKALSGFYYVFSDNKVIQCRSRGVFRKNKVNPLVGDEVIFQAENDLEGYILEVKERKNSLVRPPVANVDQAILVFSATEPDFSTALLDRFLVLIEFNQIRPIICITKIDLMTEAEKQSLEQVVQDYERAGYDVILTSSETDEGLEELTTIFEWCDHCFCRAIRCRKVISIKCASPRFRIKNRPNFQSSWSRKTYDKTC